MSISDEIKQIKEAHSAAVIEKAKNEERLVSLNEQKEKINQQSRAIGVEPENLGAEKELIESQIEEKLIKARAILGIPTPMQTNDLSAPF